MNDICKTSKLLSFILFADDTTVFYSNSNIKTLCSTINNELKEVVNWFKCNKLSLNAAKTNLIFIGTPNKTKNITSDVHIYLDGCLLKRVPDAKFLGLILDENITWKSHIRNICKTCSRNIGVLNKLKHILPKPSLYQLYCTLILPYLNYGIILWGDANKEHITRLFKLQKRAIRIINNSSYLCHTKPLFEKCNTLNVFELYQKELCIFMYKYNKGLLPKSFDNVFKDMKGIHKYDTRHKDNYCYEIHKLNNVLSSGPKAWNGLPSDIKSAIHFHGFKRKIVNHIKQIK